MYSHILGVHSLVWFCWRRGRKRQRKNLVEEIQQGKDLDSSQAQLLVSAALTLVFILFSALVPTKTTSHTNWEPI